ncbi:MAG: hypothetical protein HQL10_10845 [Nitrospirae bacterium]|nr:hypothetical protein [Nitrospirota bacterium]
MQEIGHTAFGRNALAIGLLGHVAALIVSIMTVSGAGTFFIIVFTLSCIFSVAGTFTELYFRGFRFLDDLKFYLLAVAVVFPFIGPIIVMCFLYSLQRKGEKIHFDFPGFIRLLSRLKANMLLVFVFLIFLFILFAFIHGATDPYFKKRQQNKDKSQTGTVVTYELICGYSSILA